MNDMQNGTSRRIGKSRKNYSSYLLSTPIKIIVAIVLGIGISVALYNVLKGSWIGRQPAQFTPQQWVNLDEESDASSAGTFPDAGQKPLLRVAVAPIVSPEKSIEMYQDFVEYLADKLERIPSPLYRESYAETNDLVRYEQCDIAIVCTYPFIRGEREFGMQALAVPQVRGEPTYSSLVLVPRSSPAASLMDLRNKRFASGDIMSTTGWLFPALWLMQKGEDPNTFFSEHMLSGSHDRSLQAVINGYVDGAAVHSLVYHMMASQDPSIMEKVKILHQSPPFGIPPVVGHPDMDSNLKKQIQSVLLDMHNDVRGRMILETLQIDRFLIPKKNHFDELRQAVSRLEGWK